MFYHNINPTLITIGPFEVRYYGIIYALGFLVSLAWLMRVKNKLGMNKDDVYDYVFYVAIGIIVGARAFEVLIWHPTYYFSNPEEIIAIWHGGLSFHGGLVGAVIVSWLFCKFRGIKLMRLADAVVIPATLMLAFGRIANFINGELYGTVTKLPWCVKFPGVSGCRHPVQLYGAIKRFIVFGIIVWLNKKKHKDGFIFWNFVALFGIGRLLIDFVREDPRFFGLSTGQWLSFVMFAIAVYVLWKSYWKK